MARKLSTGELAFEADATVELIERLSEIGVLKPDEVGLHSAGDLIRLEAIAAFLESGLTMDQLRAALEEGIFTFEYLDRFHPEPTPTTGRTFSEFGESLGVEPSLLRSVYLGMGIPEPSPDRAMRQDEEALLSQFIDAWRLGGDEETYRRAARLIGEPARLVAEGWTRLYVEKVSDPLLASGAANEDRISTIVESTEKLTQLAPDLLLWLLNRHLRHAIDTANIEGLEQEVVRVGITLPMPSQPPAVAFVDISGYTRLTETHGDQIAAETADRLRDLAEDSARSHGGTLVKLLGDAVMFHFGSVDGGLDGVLELVGRLQAEGLTAHAGIHAGPMIERDGDYFGGTVNLASRAAGVAKAGEIVVTEAVVTATRAGFSFEPLPRANLKGIEEPIALYRAQRAATPQQA